MYRKKASASLFRHSQRPLLLRWFSHASRPVALIVFAHIRLYDELREDNPRADEAHCRQSFGL